MNRITLIFVAIVALASCSPDAPAADCPQVPAPQACPEDLSQQLESARASVLDSAVTIDELRADLERTQQALAASERRADDLAATPDGAMAELVKTVDAADTRRDVEAAMIATAKYRERFGSTPQARAARSLETKLKSKLKEIDKTARAAEAKRQAAAFDGAVAKLHRQLASIEDYTQIDPRAPEWIQEFTDVLGMKSNDVPKITFGEAMKDIDAALGRQIIFSGRVAQIQRSGDHFVGLLCGGFACAEPLSFIVLGESDGIVAGRRARFGGLVVQRHVFPNVGGGTTIALGAVGYFIP